MSGRADQIRAIFDAIARRYDLLNTVFSLDRDRSWRRRAAAAAGLRPGETAVDVCTGTGKMAHELLPHVQPGGRVVGIDFSARMLERARRREPDIELREGDASRLPFPDASVDAVTMAFGLRNLVDRMGALREMLRVLRPGRRAVILEFAPPSRGARARLYRAYIRGVIPAIAGVVLPGQRDAYRYLADSVEEFPAPAELAGAMQAAGFSSVTVRGLTLGIVALHTGTRPAASTFASTRSTPTGRCAPSSSAAIVPLRGSICSSRCRSALTA